MGALPAPVRAVRACRAPGVCARACRTHPARARRGARLPAQPPGSACPRGAEKLSRESFVSLQAMRTSEKWCSKWCSKIQKRRGTFLRMTLAYTIARTQDRPKTEILRISVGIPDLCEFRPIAFEGEIRERKEAAPRATRPANATITHFAEFWPGLYYRTSVNMGSVKFQTPGDTVLARP